MICPFALWKPVLAHGGPLNGSTLLGVVEHVTAGEGDPYNEFANPANQVSSHFGIGNGQGGMADGVLEQYVDTSMQSWAQAAGNGTYISVETEGQPTEALTAAQVNTFGRLMAWCQSVHGIPLVVVDTPGQRGLIAHGDGGQAWGGHLGCPGDLRKAQRPAILAVASQQNPETPVAAPTQEELMSLVIAPDGTKVIERVSPAGDLLVFTKAPATLINPTPLWQVDDVTAELAKSFPADPPFKVLP